MRKTKLTYEMVDRAVALKKDGLSNGDIINALGIRKSKFYRWLKDAEESAGGCKRALKGSLPSRRMNIVRPDRHLPNRLSLARRSM